MLFTLFRTANAIFAVMVAILVSSRYGETATGKLITVAVTSGVVAFFEWLMKWSPKHFDLARSLLDPRAAFAGVWVQDVDRVLGSEGPNPLPNRFAVFSVRYNKSQDNYVVEGDAYTKTGEPHARWDSGDVVHFAKDGQSMTYDFEGNILTGSGAENRERKGITNLKLSSNTGGSGHVNHLALNVTLIFNFTRVTPKWLAERDLGQFNPKALHDRAGRKPFALEYAKTLKDEDTHAASAGKF
jgi:hypothetical protein